MSAFRCPQCDNPAELCNKSDHGAIGGPALHCTRFPSHNEWDPAAFYRWAEPVQAALSIYWRHLHASPGSPGQFVCECLGCQMGRALLPPADDTRSTAQQRTVSEADR